MGPKKSSQKIKPFLDTDFFFGQHEERIEEKRLLELTKQVLFLMLCLCGSSREWEIPTRGPKVSRWIPPVKGEHQEARDARILHAFRYKSNRKFSGTQVMFPDRKYFFYALLDMLHK